MLAADRQRGDLLGAGPLEEEHADPRLGRRLPHRQGAVITQQHQGLVAKIRHQSSALVVVQRHPLIAVIGDLMLQQAGILAQRQQAFLLRRHADPGDRVQMDHVMGVLPCAMDGGMDGETGRIDETGRLLDDVPVKIDLDQAGRRHLLEIPAVGVDQEMMLGSRNARRDMGEDHVVPPVQGHQPVEGRQLDPGGPLRLGDPGFQGNGRAVGHDRHPHSLSRRTLALPGVVVKIQLPLTAS